MVLYLPLSNWSKPSTGRVCLPLNEPQRLAALRRFQILDTPPEDEFDALVGLVLRICGVPMAMISLVDEDRQWFKAKAGVALDETPREIAFCAHTILGQEPLLVGDALKDPRFAQNPLVTGEPFIRFYGGFPLITCDGLELGALCALDHRPRRLSCEQVQDMKALARQVMALLELREANARLENAEAQLETLRPLVPVCARCNRVRDDREYWQLVEEYIKARGEAEFIDGLCPECREIRVVDGSR